MGGYGSDRVFSCVQTHFVTLITNFSLRHTRMCKISSPEIPVCCLQL